MVTKNIFSSKEILWKFAKNNIFNSSKKKFLRKNNLNKKKYYKKKHSVKKIQKKIWNKIKIKKLIIY